MTDTASATDITVSEHTSAPPSGTEFNRHCAGQHGDLGGPMHGYAASRLPWHLGPVRWHSVASVG